MVKKITVFTLVLIFCLSYLGVTESTANSISEMRNRRSQIDAREARAREELAAIRSQRRTLANEIAALDIEIQLAEDQLQFIIERLEAVNLEHQKTTEELRQAEEEKDNYYISIKKRLKFIHENGRIGYYQVLFNAKSFGDFLNRVEYVNDIIAYDQRTYARLREIEETIAEKKLQIEEQLAEIQVLLLEQEEKLEKLEQAKAAKDVLMTEVLTSEQRQQEMINTLEAESKELERRIRAAQEEAARRAEAASRNNRLPGSTGSGVTPSGGRFAWPVPGWSSVSSGFVNRTNPVTGRREFHTGIDIPASRGTPVVAAEAGTVIMAGNNGGYGLCVVIDHGNGVSTLYGHHSSITVSVGQSVSRGETIARIGSTGISTGPHLHFEVRVNGSPVNPGGYLY
jgi:murein DD-endopeptidase MepM/ murein hydrolase activator NlpD